MTSCVLSLLFLLSLISSNVAQDPSGFGMRITDRALNLLTQQAQRTLEQMVGHPFEDMPLKYGPVKRNFTNLTITAIRMNLPPTLRFEQDSGFHFAVQNMFMSVTFGREIIAFLGPGNSNISANTDIDIAVRMTRNQGRLNVNLPQCTITFSDFNHASPSSLWNTFITPISGILWYFFNQRFARKICTFLEQRVQAMLETIPMTIEVERNLNISVDYSLVKDIQVTESSLDMYFRGYIYMHGNGDDQRNPTVVPAIHENGKMAYIAISEYFFNSAAYAFFNAGAMKETFTNLTSATKTKLRVRQSVSKPWRMREKLSVIAEVSQVPLITIDTSGIHVQVRPKVRGLSGGENVFTSVSMNCKVMNVQVAIVGNNLTLPAPDTECKIITKNVVRDLLVKPLNTFIARKIKDMLQDVFDGGIQIPLPAGFEFTESEFDYQNGSVVIGGDLNVTAPARDRLIKHLFTMLEAEEK